MNGDGAPSDWDGFQKANADLFRGPTAALEPYYLPGTLASPAAREAFLPPDRPPL